MMTKLFTAVVLMTFLRDIPASEPPLINWVKGYTNPEMCESHNRAGVQTSDGGYFLVGDGECYDRVVPFERQITVAKVDETGELEWMTNIGDIGFNYGKFGIELSDGTFLASGSIALPNPEGDIGYLNHRGLVRLSEDGEILHIQTFPNTQAEQQFRDGFMGMAHAGDTSIIITGWLHSEAGDNDDPAFLSLGGYAFLMKLSYSTNTSADFSVVFEQVFNSTAATDFIAFQGFRVAEVDEGYIISAAAYEADFSPHFALLRTNLDGVLEWMNMYPAEDTSHPYAFTVAEDTDGEMSYVIAGLAIGEEGPVGRITKINLDGETEWNTQFRNPTANYSTECYGVVQTPSGGFLTVCGTGPLYDQGSEPWMVLAQRVDSEGKELWLHLYTDQSSATNTGEYVVVDRNGGYAVYLDTQTWGSPETGGNFGIMHLEGGEQGEDAWWQVTLGVVGGLVLLAVVYICIKKKNNQQHSLNAPDLSAYSKLKS